MLRENERQNFGTYRILKYFMSPVKSGPQPRISGYRLVCLQKLFLFLMLFRRTGLIWLFRLCSGHRQPASKEHQKKKKLLQANQTDRKSTRLNSSHRGISYADIGSK